MPAGAIIVTKPPYGWSSCDRYIPLIYNLAEQAPA
jgi:hypothetical protein